MAICEPHHFGRVILQKTEPFVQVQVEDQVHFPGFPIAGTCGIGYADPGDEAQQGGDDQRLGSHARMKHAASGQISTVTAPPTTRSRNLAMM
ncbi:hypothetical protein [Rhizobium sp. RU20A]|uniref:hypothetical protein n=1 Tax=Rhizobium sp. RU20A TaxID=1907412 RepID=UPI00122CC458|nr:hypothetical protein [Rhizobium sp. RU20A]